MSNDSKVPIPDSQQVEPTVLDLFKSIFKDWKSFFNFVASVFDAARREQINRSLTKEQALIVDPQPQSILLDSQKSPRIPWRALLGVGFALYAQQVLEPEGRNASFGLIIYTISISLILWSYFKNEWSLPTLAPSHDRHDPETIRFIPLIIATVLAAIAYASFDGNRFGLFNITFWLLSISFFVYAFWLPYRRVRHEQSAEERRKNKLWTLLVLGVVVIVVFFRVYQIDSVPPEPISDHAEKILDVFEISQGETRIFFPRNTGREAIQMYWTLLITWVFGTGFTFLSLKIGTVIFGLLTLPYMYLLGKEFGGKRVGLFALLFAGIGYWPNLISRIGLRFPLYPLFVAPTLYYLIKGLRTRNRNDFILSGLFLGLGLHGYSPIRVLPIVVVVAIVLYLFQTLSKRDRRDAVMWLAILSLASLLVFIPLLRYTVDFPDTFSSRFLSRVSGSEQDLPEPALEVFFSNLWNALLMFNWDDGEVWVNSIPHRPALDVVSGALFLIGIFLLLIRYIRKRHWLHLFLLLSIPLLALPSILSLAFPGENPALNRAAGAYVPAFIVVGLALDGLLTAIGRGKMRTIFAWGLTLGLVSWSGYLNYDLVFNQHFESYRKHAWNSSEMGAIVKEFNETYGHTETIWIVAFPHWVDTRLPGVWAGIPNRDLAIWRDNLPETVELPGPKLFMVRANLQVPEANDMESINTLEQLYPKGTTELYKSSVAGKDFWIFTVP